MWRVLVVVVVAGCINQIQAALAPPEPASGGTLTCAQIVVTCDSACTQPLCLHGCSSNGTPDARQQHDAVLACAEQHGCADEACIRASCPSEVEACQGPPPAPAPAPPPAS